MSPEDRIRMQHMLDAALEVCEFVGGTSFEAFCNKRFSSFVMDEAYLLAAVRYVEMNPVRAGIIQRPEDYPWSSYRFYIGEKKPEWLHTEFILNYFNKEMAKAQSE
jgi:hypothetical protein